MIGNTVLGYHVDEKIGAGGFGTVYKVSKTNASGTYVRALKHITLPTKKQYSSVLNSMGGDYSKADDYFASILKDIVSEISILSTLSESGTKNIVRYYENDIVETPSPKAYDIYILMEFLTPFTDYIENKSFTVHDVITLGKDILTALMACHEKKIIHRDIKDDNIFVSSDGVYKLGDFGVSKALKDKSRAESVKGTPNFIAPEVYLGKEKYDNTVDLYSLGIVLYKLLNKSRNPFMPKYPAPYSNQDEDAAFEARMTGKVPDLPIDAENELGQAVLKALMPRNDRYNTAAEFYAALQAAEKSLGAEALSQNLRLSVPQPFMTAKAASETFGKGTYNNETVGCDVSNTANETVAAGARHSFETIGVAVEKKESFSEAPQSKTTLPKFSDNETFGTNAPGNANETVGAAVGQPSLNTIGSPAEPKEEIYEPSKSTTLHQKSSNNETIGNDVLKKVNETVDNSSDRHLFDTIGSPVAPKEEFYEPPKKKTPPKTYENDFVPDSWDTYTPPVAPPQVEAISKKDFKWLLYLSPVLIAAAWLIVYLCLIPALYGKAVSFVEWFVEDPTEIVDSIKDSSNILTPIYQIILLRIYNWLTVVGLITSFFFIGRSIQNKRPEPNYRAKLHGKEPYTITIGILEEIKIIGGNTEKARKAVHLLNERLKNESAFGEGSDTVIDCENEIAAYLQAIQGLIPGLHDENSIAEATRQIEMLSQRCLAKLKVRIELKKR